MEPCGLTTDRRLTQQFLNPRPDPAPACARRQFVQGARDAGHILPVRRGSQRLDQHGFGLRAADALERVHQPGTQRSGQIRSRIVIPDSTGKLLLDSGKHQAKPATGQLGNTSDCGRIPVRCDPPHSFCQDGPRADLKGHETPAPGKRAPCASPWVSDPKRVRSPVGARQAITCSRRADPLPVCLAPLGLWVISLGVLPRATPLADSGLAPGYRLSPRWGWGHRSRRGSERRDSTLVSIERLRPGVAALVGMPSGTSEKPTPDEAPPAIEA